MYEELIKHLRNRANGSYEEKCDGCPYEEDFPPCVHCTIKAFNEAADAIEARDKAAEEWEILSECWRKACKGLENRMPRWIPVTERLPEEDELVLVWRNNGLPYVSRRIDLSYWVGLGRDAGVTHWMPLPEPPKEET